MYYEARYEQGGPGLLFRDPRWGGGVSSPKGLKFLATHVYRAVCAIFQPHQVMKEYLKASPRPFWPGFSENKNILNIL